MHRNFSLPDMEHTLYHYCIPQDSEKNVWKALDMFSSFFKCPLLNENSIERELNAVESEFELNSKDDHIRLSQLMSYTCGMDGNAPIMGRNWRPVTRTGYDDGEKVEGVEAEVGAERYAKDRPLHPFAKVRCSVIVVGSHALVSPFIFLWKHLSHILSTRLLPFSHSLLGAKISFLGETCLH